MKYRRHLALQTYKMHIKKDLFLSSTVEKVDVIREIKNLSKKKAIQDDDTPVKILKENAFFSRDASALFTIMH